MQELATCLFCLNLWRAELSDPSAATALARRLADRCTDFDGPALCTAVWALQQLTAAAAETASAADEPNSAVTAAGFAAALDPEALGRIESHLVALLEAPRVVAARDRARGDAHKEVRERRRAPPPVPPPAIADSHLLRFLTAAAAQRYAPERLLAVHYANLGARLKRIDGRGPGTPGAEARKRAIWAAARCEGRRGLGPLQIGKRLRGHRASVGGVVW